MKEGQVVPILTRAQVRESFADLGQALGEMAEVAAEIKRAVESGNLKYAIGALEELRACLLMAQVTSQEMSQ